MPYNETEDASGVDETENLRPDTITALHEGNKHRVIRFAVIAKECR